MKKFFLALVFLGSAISFAYTLERADVDQIGGAGTDQSPKYMANELYGECPECEFNRQRARGTLTRDNGALTPSSLANSIRTNK